MTALANAPAPIVIKCDRRGRHGDYDPEKAIERFGNIGLDDFVFRIASAECARMKHPNQHACMARLAGRKAAA